MAAQKSGQVVLDGTTGNEHEQKNLISGHQKASQVGAVRCAPGRLAITVHYPDYSLEGHREQATGEQEIKSKPHIVFKCNQNVIYVVCILLVRRLYCIVKVNCALLF